MEDIRRVQLRRGRSNQREVIVLFNDIEARDRVTSYARNLAQFIDQAGKPTAGIRFDIPDHLSGVHRTLLQYGHAMWNKYRRDPSFKRNIRYDDVDMTFCLDMKLPGREDWITATYARALRDRRAGAALDQERDDLLSSAGDPPGLEMVMEHEPGSASAKKGASAAGGSVTSTSWRAPKK